jgi:hypothetical protein
MQPPCPTDVHTGNDQFWPWVDVNERGHLNIAFKDRRLDTNSTAHEWPTSRQRPGNYLVWTWGAQCQVSSSNATQCVAPAASLITSPGAPVNPGVGDIPPGAGPTFLGNWKNFGISDVPSNYDYSFRAGIFAGDYEVVAVEGNDAYAHFTDARNGRSSGGPAGGATFPSQPGRNPACEQSDTFVEHFPTVGSAYGQNSPKASDSLFLVTPCPGDD